jgi:hypothetical protein
MFDKFITEVSGIKPSQCSCNTCKDMCHTAPCIGTPEEMAALVTAGFKDDLINTTIKHEKVKVTLGMPSVTIIGIKFDNKKQKCVMLNDDGLCKLHSLGLKPTEGRFANCKTTELKPNKISPFQAVLLTWKRYILINSNNGKTIKY